MTSFNWSEESQKQWNERAESWHSQSSGMWESGSRKEILPFLKKNIPTRSRICDLGCGDGYASSKLAREGFQVTGIDVSEEMITKARKQAEGTPTAFIRSDISSIPTPEESFDAVMAINSLEWTESPLSVLGEIKRILTPEGVACIGILGPTAMPRVNSYRRLYGEKVICNTMMPWELEKLAEENGLVKIDELPVYKRGVDRLLADKLPTDLRQSLSFMWVFMFKIL